MGSMRSLSRSMRSLLILVSLLFSPLLVFIGCASANVRAFSAAPRNPEFLKYQQQRPFAIQGARGEGRRSGYRPSPLDLSHVKPPLRTAPQAMGRGALPASFDLRDAGVTPVRNQGPYYGPGWAFSALASLESTFKKRDGVEQDFSEWHIAYYAYMNRSDALPAFTLAEAISDDLYEVFEQAGNSWQAAALLARGTGAVDESVRPYGAMLPQESDPVSKYLKHVYHLPVRPGGGAVDNDALKRAVMDYGAVSICEVYTTPGGSEYHFYAIIGWDDDYEGGIGFISGDTEPGAWLLKDSWGTEYLGGDVPTYYEDGYIWFSYAGNFIDPAFFIGADAANFENIHQYDPLGWTGSYGYEGNDTAWFANIFTGSGSSASAHSRLSSDGEQLKAVSFYAAQTGATYQIEIWTGVEAGNPRSGTLARTQSGTLPAAGYHTVAMDSHVYLLRGERFSVVMKLTTPGYNSPVPVEENIPGYSENATANAGESYVSELGEAWTDITAIAGHAFSNVCLKAFTSGYAGAIRYVNAAATGANDGASWNDAYKELRDALAAAQSGDEIWVAAGRYTPHASDRTVSFALKSSVALYGGFPATGNPLMPDRDPATHKSILTGDIDRNDTTDADGLTLLTANRLYIIYNSNYVVRADGVNADALLDGFCVTGGYARGDDDIGRGAGMHNTNNARPTVVSCTFSGNFANVGGGMYNSQSSPTVMSSTFSENTANSGGGMCNDNSSPTVTNSTFSNNRSEGAGFGGGMYNYSSSPTLTNCTFSRNRQVGYIVFLGDGLANMSSSPTVTNCIFWGTDGPEYQIGSSGDSTPIITYSIVDVNECPGAGNTNADPRLGRLVDNGGPTKTHALFAGSSALGSGTSAGAPATDQRGVARPQGTGVDRGAVEMEGIPEPTPISVIIPPGMTLPDGSVVSTPWPLVVTLPPNATPVQKREALRDVLLDGGIPEERVESLLDILEVGDDGRVYITVEGIERLQGLLGGLEIPEGAEGTPLAAFMAMLGQGGNSLSADEGTAIAFFEIPESFRGKTAGNLHAIKALTSESAEAFVMVFSLEELLDRCSAVVEVERMAEGNMLKRVLGSDDLISANCLLALAIKDGGSFDLDGTADGIVVDPVFLVEGQGGSAPDGPHGGSGCASGGFSPWLLALFAPLALLAGGAGRK